MSTVAIIRSNAIEDVRRALAEHGGKDALAIAAERMAGALDDVHDALDASGDTATPGAVVDLLDAVSGIVHELRMGAVTESRRRLDAAMGSSGKLLESTIAERQARGEATR